MHQSIEQAKQGVCDGAHIEVTAPPQFGDKTVFVLFFSLERPQVKRNEFSKRNRNSILSRYNRRPSSAQYLRSSPLGY